MGIFVGAALGALSAIAIYVLGFGLELLNCACQIVTFNCEGGDAIPFLWQDGSFWKVLIFCTIAGAVIGLIYEIVQAKAKADKERAQKEEEQFEAAKQRRMKLAQKAKSSAQSKLEQVYTLQKQVEKYNMTPRYVSSDLQETGWKQLNSALSANEEIKILIENLEQ